MNTSPSNFQEQRMALGDALVCLGQEFPDLVVLSPDVSISTRTIKYKTAFPDRFICSGISEQNTIGMAAGLSTMGWVPVVAGYAMFVGGKAWEPIRNSIAYPHLNVKIVATHGGINVGADGVTHQAIEDLALMRSIPGMIVLTPMDANQVEPALRAALTIQGPVYIRLERAAIPVLSEANAPYPIGGSIQLREGRDATVFAIGGMAAMAVNAADALAQEGLHIRVVSMLSVKPLDEAAIVAAAQETGAIVTAEDHNRCSGLGGAVAETLARLAPAPVEQIALDDTFAESGSVNELYAKYHLTSNDIIGAVKKVISRSRAIRSL
ncbi:MAG TPA: transketolase C-terminal domain-containing protein [Anaerolineaceae bacterium]|nr:transketolase C-terminal domain-containing protein [Anaerolineaceae bacterium]